MPDTNPTGVKDQSPQQARHLGLTYAVIYLLSPGLSEAIQAKNTRHRDHKPSVGHNWHWIREIIGIEGMACN
jgi:hypothetical protein